MKRFIVTTLLVITVLGAMICSVPHSFASVLPSIVPSNAVICVCCRQTSLPSINLGYGYLTYCNLNELDKTLRYCSIVDGLSATFDGTLEDFVAIRTKLRLTQFFVQQLDNVCIVSGKSDVIKGGVYLDGQQINVQIAYADGVITVGSPLILGEY